MLSALLLASALAQTPIPNSGASPQIGPIARIRRTSDDLQPLFSLMPANGSGMPTITNLCDAIQSGDKSGSWWCLNGDGTMASGSALTLTGQNSPTIQNFAACPNGPNCTAVDRLKLLAASSQYYKSASTAVPTGSFSFVVIYALAGSSTTYTLGGKRGAALTFAIEDQASGGSGIRLYVDNGTTQSGTAPFTASVLHADRVACATYSTSDGIPRMRSGGSSTVGAALSPATPRAQSLEHSVGAQSTGSLPFDGRIRGAFFTEKALSDSDCDRLEAAVNPKTITGIKGEAITFSRASLGTCCKDYEGTNCVMQDSSWPCISGFGGLSVERSTTNVLLRSYELNNAAWSEVGTSVVTANFYTGPIAGWQDAEKLTDDDGAAYEGVQQVITTTLQRRFIFSAWMRSDTATKATVSWVGGSNSAGDKSCTFTDLTSTFTRKTCISDAAYSGNPATVTLQILVGTSTADTGSIGIAHANMTTDGAYWTTDSHVSSYIPSTSAAVVRAQSTATFATPSGASDSAGCVALSWYVKYNGVTPLGGTPLSSNADTRPCYRQSTSAIRAYDSTNTVNLGSLSGLEDAVFRCSGSWSGSSLVVKDLIGNTSASGSYDGAILATPWTIGSSQGTTNFFDGYVGQVVFGRSSGGCR